PGAACPLQKGVCLLSQQCSTKQYTTHTQCGLRIDCHRIFHLISFDLSVELSAHTYSI
ncbi:unnamed protein product, partial [Ectocarpus sp. 8 AP-2014]